jgi:O-antigen ligase
MRDPAVHGFLRGSAGAGSRARIFRLLQFSLLVWASVYLVLVAMTGHTYLRSVAFGIALIFAVWLTLGSWLSDAEPVPAPDGYLLAAILAWAGWSAASVLWSVHPEYSLAELGTEVVWGLATIMIFYVAVRTARAYRVLLTTAIAICALLAVLAAFELLGPDAVETDRALVRSHGGVGAYSTYLVLVIPLLPLLLLPPPSGYGSRVRVIVPVVALLGLLLFAARLTENRMVWIALAAAALLAAVLCSWRWRARLERSPWRWTAILVALLLIFTALFIDAAEERARTDFAPGAPVARTLAEDPRFVLWTHTFERIRERPWLGYGFGKSILREELRSTLNNPMLAHAHNLFVSQWAQTGAIGVITLLGLLAAIAWRYLSFARSADGTLAALGICGLTLLAAFLVKNMTDDFLVRPTSKEFWAINAMLIGHGIRRVRAPALDSGPSRTRG